MFTGTTRLLPALRRLLFGGGATPALPLLALATGVTFLLNGYEVFVRDQLLYLALVPRYVDASTIHPNDVYLSLFFPRTYTTLFLALTPAIRWFGWEWPLFVAYVAVRFFILWGVWSLTFGMTRDRLASALAVIFLLTNAPMRSQSVQFFAPNFISRYAVIPLLYFGFKWVRDRRFPAAAIAFGLAFHVHAMSALYWIAITTFCALCNLRSLLFTPLAETEAAGASPAAALRRPDPAALRRWLAGCALFGLLALPIMVWKWLTPFPPAHADFSAADWFDFHLNWKHFYIFFSQWSASKLLRLGLVGVLFCIPLRQMRRDRVLSWYLPAGIGTLLVLGVHYAATEIFRSQPLYQLQWYRATDVLTLFATLGFARVISAEAARGRGWIAALAGGCFLTSIATGPVNIPFMAAAMILAVAMMAESRRRPVSTVLAALGVPILWVWSYLKQNPDGDPLHFGTPSVFCVLAAVCLAAVFHARPAPAPAPAEPAVGGPRHLLRWGLHAIGLLALIGLVWIAPTTQRFGRTQQPISNSISERWRGDLRRITFPGAGMDDDFIRLQQWAREHTPPQALFFIPPGINGFRVFSERSVVVESHDGETGIFCAQMAREWQLRMRLFGYEPGARGLRAAARTFHRLPPERWRELADQYDARYLVMGRDLKLPFTLLHREGRYTIWRVDAD